MFELYPKVRVLLPYISSHEVCGAFGGLIVLLEQVAFSVYLQLLLVCCKIWCNFFLAGRICKQSMDDAPSGG